MPILLIVSQNHLREKPFQIYDIVAMSLFKPVISLKAPKTKYANQKQTMQKDIRLQSPNPSVGLLAGHLRLSLLSDVF